ncbi:MAG: helix-turn-helix transcriptional regulator [Desulfobacterales bacterium]|nr:helix-turn-helix transcriptional regulator [Desulfobacterales bacterium]
MPKKKADTLVSVGSKIKKIREKKNVTFEQIANDTGCSIDYLQKIESGEIMPPVGVLLQVSRALDINSDLLLKDNGTTVKKRVQAYNKRTENYAYTALTPVAENKHLKAFKIMIEPMKDHEGVGYQHEGEEFIYVLSGRIEVIVGENVNNLNEGESLHFNSGIRHKIKNIDNKQAELLVVIYV